MAKDRIERDELASKLMESTIPPSPAWDFSGAEHLHGTTMDGGWRAERPLRARADYGVGCHLRDAPGLMGHRWKTISTSTIT